VRTAPRARAWFPIALLLLVALALEGLSFGSIHLLERLRPMSVVELYLARHFEEKLDARRLAAIVAGHHHPVLGWAPKPGRATRSRNSADVEWVYSVAANGARDGPGNAGPLRVATYGDSFTAGAEVGNDETWQTHLAARLGGAVLNFGAIGYGILQSVMRMEEDLDAQRVAPVTILGIHESNLSRVLNRFRPLRARRSGNLLGFKPAMRYRDGEIRFLPNPWSDAGASLEALEELARRAARDDYFAERMIRLRAPFTWSLASGLWRQMRPELDADEFWEIPEGCVLARHLIDRFVLRARDAGSRPVLLFFPGAEHVRRGTPPHYRDARDAARRDHPELLVVDMAEEDFDRKLWNVIPYHGHLSAYGNEVVARVLGRALGTRADERSAAARGSGAGTVSGASGAAR
jgi:hypothetical protein